MIIQNISSIILRIRRIFLQIILNPKLLENFFGVIMKNKEVLQKHNETVSTYFKSIDPQYLNIDAYL